MAIFVREWRRIGRVGTFGLLPCVLITRRSQVQILPPLPTSSQVRGPFPSGEGLLPCVARDQIRDQIADQRRLSRPTPSQAKPRIEIRGTYCNGSGHLGRGRRVENPATAHGWKLVSHGRLNTRNTEGQGADGSAA